jgi:hypothetical protein
VMSRRFFAIRSAITWTLFLFVAAPGLAYGQQPPVELQDHATGLLRLIPPVPSSNRARGSAPKNYFKDIWADQKTIWASPFRMNRRQWLSIALPLSAGTAALLATDERAMHWLPNSGDQVLWSRRTSDVGAFYVLGGMVGGTMLYDKLRGHSDWHKIGISASQALADSFIVSTALKYTAARERPISNDGEGRFWKGQDSFPSGHTMCSFAITMAIVRSKQTPKWLKVTSIGVSAAVGLARWAAQKHFPADVFVGGVLGGLIGNYVGVHRR